MQNPWPFLFVELAFDHATCHLDTDAEHRLGDFHVLTLKERLGILGEIQSHQGAFIFGPAQFDSAVW